MGPEKHPRPSSRLVRRSSSNVERNEMLLSRVGGTEARVRGEGVESLLALGRL